MLYYQRKPDSLEQMIIISISYKLQLATHFLQEDIGRNIAVDNILMIF